MVDRFSKIINSNFFKEFSWHTAASFITQLFSFIGMIFVSRYLGPTNLGMLSFVQTYLALFMTVLGAMDYYFTFYIAKSHDHVRDTFEYVIRKTQVAIAVSFLGIILAYIYLPVNVFIMSVILFVPVVLNGLSAFITYANSQRLAKLVSITQIATAAFFLFLKMALLLSSADIKYFVLVQALDIVAASLFLSFYFFFIKKWKSYLHLNTLRIGFKNTLQLLFDIRYNLVLVGFWQLIMRADQLILAKFSNAYILGIYAAAVKLAEAPNAIVAILGIVVFPRIVSYLGSGSSYGVNQINKYRNLYVVCGIFITASLILFANIIIGVLYGDNFLESVNILKIYAVSITGLFASYYYMIVFGAMEERVLPAIIAVISAAINIFLVILFTYYYGMLGTAAASAISYSLAGFLFHFAYKYKIKKSKIS